jgi:hypothetical protein
MAKTKRGRPALPGDRYPSGERRDTTDPRAENVFQRFAELEKTVGLDPRLTSQIGRLRYLKLLSDGQAAAADKVGQIYGRFERIHARRRYSVSPSYQLGRGYGEREYDTDIVKAAEADYRALQDCIPLLPREARDIIEQLCVENCAVPSLYLPEVRVILDRVAMEFGLGTQGDEDRISAASTRRRVPRAQSRKERFEQGGYAYCSPDAVPLPSRHHADGSLAAQEHEQTVRRIEEGNERRDTEPTS